MKIKFEEFYNNYCEGEITHLQKHKDILKLIYERNLEQYKNDIEDFNYALKTYRIRSGAGFSWMLSPEGWDFWSDILTGKITKHFYERYPRIKTCKLD